MAQAVVFAAAFSPPPVWDWAAWRVQHLLAVAGVAPQLSRQQRAGPARLNGELQKRHSSILVLGGHRAN